MTRLGVNIDHIATLRQARRETFPDPLQLALQAVRGGADGITAHLREDRRHIQDADVWALKNKLSVPLNMEMAIAPEVVRVALKIKPQWACLVPERRVELTTEGGLNLKRNPQALAHVIQKLHLVGTRVSLFVAPGIDNARRARTAGADAVEFHTGAYARLWPRPAVKKELRQIQRAAREARRLGLVVNAGHGIDYANIRDLNRAFDFDEYNIGFAIVARSVYVGMQTAVREMKQKMKR